MPPKLQRAKNTAVRRLQEKLGRMLGKQSMQNQDQDNIRRQPEMRAGEWLTISHLGEASYYRPPRLG